MSGSWRRCGLLAAVLIACASAPAIAATTFTYDDLGRVTSETYDDGKEIIYSYDAAGNRTQVVITATIANRQPLAQNDTLAATTLVAASLDPRSNDTDPDGNTLTVTAVGSAAHGTTSIGGGGTSVSYTSVAGYAGPDSFTYTVSDPSGAKATASIVVTVTTPTNHAPVAVNDSQTVTSAAPANFDPRVNDSDPDGDTLTITSVGTPSHGTAVIAGAGTSVTYTSVAGYTGSDSFGYTISDTHSATASATISITVSAGNRPPVAVNDFIAPAIATATSFDPRTNDSDPDGDTFLVTSVTAPLNGTASVGSGGISVTYTGNSGYSGPDSFAYTITDSHGATAQATVTANVGNIAPIAVDDELSVHGLPGSHPSGTLDPRANDFGTGITVTGVTNGTLGTVTIISGGVGVIYQKTGVAAVGTDSFTYTITDSSSRTATATVNVELDVDSP